MRVSQAPVFRRRRRVAAALAVAIVGLGLGMLTAELWWPRGASDAAASTLAERTPAVSTSPAVASSTPTPMPTAGTASAAPVASPSPQFDVAAHSLTAPDSPWVVVNKISPLDPVEYAPADLVTVAGVPGGATMREEAAAAMTALRAAAAQEGAGFAISTAYRTYGQQAGLYQTYVNRSGRERADRYSARPGYSEHQTGLAADINGGGCDLEACFGDTAAGVYVARHAWEHGYVVRYPEGKEAVTGYIYEPWHLRYVGPELAAQMHQRGIETLEEFFGLPAASDYA